MAAIQVNMRVPEVLLAQINAAAGDERTKWILEACRMRLDGGRPEVSESQTPATQDASLVIQPLADLRAIAAGSLPARTSSEFLDDADVQLPEARALCPKVGFNETDGESYRCKLARGHRGNCQPGEQI